MRSSNERWFGSVDRLQTLVRECGQAANVGGRGVRLQTLGREGGQAANIGCGVWSGKELVWGMWVWIVNVAL